MSENITSMRAYEYGREAERERIIALLKTYESGGWVELGFEHLVEIIKGEQNE